MTLPGDAAPGPGDEVILRWYAARARVEAEREARLAADAETRLASDAERASVCELLNGAYGEGRLTSTELDERTSAALEARTHGDLADVLTGLAGPGSPMLGNPRVRNPRVPRGLAARLMFWVVGFFTAPFIFFGTMFLLLGSNTPERVVGIVMLVLFLPGLIALYRWAHPRS